LFDEFTPPSPNKQSVECPSFHNLIFFFRHLPESAKLFSLRAATRPAAALRSVSPLRQLSSRPLNTISLSNPRIMAALDAQKYTPAEESEIQTWLDKATSLKVAASDALLDTLNNDLATRTTALGTKPSKADVALYESLAPLVKAWTPEQRTGEQGRPNIVRLVDFVQNSPLFGLNVADADKVQVDADEILYVKPPVDAKAEKERLKKEKAAAAAAAAAGGDKTLVDRTKEAASAVANKAAEVKDKVVEAVAGEGGKQKQKKEKKERAPKQPAPPPAPAVLSPCLIDLRVGHILKAIKHPEADSLYVSTIAMGDKPGTEDTSEYEGQVVRTVCSGLNGLVPLEEMQGRKVVVVCNLKPVKMRGIKSSAMVLAASPKPKEGEDDHKGPVELVSPPADAKAGERVYFEGWQGEPEKVLNPKKKIWETFQPGFTTTDALEVAFDAGVVEALEGKTGLGKLVTASGGLCKVASLKGAQVR
jgi:aminoacyl tRNA synthase complex-interacting multifunctional protein 1